MGNPGNNIGRVGMCFVVDGVNGPASIVVADDSSEGHDGTGFGAFNHFHEISDINIVFGDRRINHIGVVVETLCLVLIFPGCLRMRSGLNFRSMMVGSGDIQVGYVSAVIVGNVGYRMVAALELVDDMVEKRANDIDRVGDTAARSGGVNNEGILAVDGHDAGEGAG